MSNDDDLTPAVLAETSALIYTKAALWLAGNGWKPGEALYGEPGPTGLVDALDTALHEVDTREKVSADMLLRLSAGLPRVINHRTGLPFVRVPAVDPDHARLMIEAFDTWPGLTVEIVFSALNRAAATAVRDFGRLSRSRFADVA